VGGANVVMMKQALISSVEAGFHLSMIGRISRLMGLVSIKAFIGLTRKFSVLKLTGYSYSTMTSYISKAQGKVDFSIHDPFKQIHIQSDYSVYTLFSPSSQIPNG